MRQMDIHYFNTQIFHYKRMFAVTMADFTKELSGSLCVICNNISACVSHLSIQGRYYLIMIGVKYRIVVIERLNSSFTFLSRTSFTRWSESIFVIVHNSFLKWGKKLCKHNVGRKGSTAVTLYLGNAL